jgi:MFS transporter, Spinster family, sphingosine-1-phosphate transporter
MAYLTSAVVTADDNAPAASKSRWLACFYLCIPVGYALGYVLGGLLGGSLGCVRNKRLK